MAFLFPQVTRLLGGEMFIDSSGSGVGQLQVKWYFIRVKPFRPHPRYAGAKRFRTEASLFRTHQIFFCPHCSGGIKKKQLNNHQSFWICACGKLCQGNQIIIVAPSCLKSSVFKMFSVHTETKSCRFQISPVWSVSGKLCLRDGLVWKVDLNAEIRLATFSIFSDVV